MSSQRMREVAPMFRFERCQSMGGNIRMANSREKAARSIAEAYGCEMSTGSGAEEGMVEFMVGSAAFELRVAVSHVVEQAFEDYVNRFEIIDEA
jgi:hypothetical protein